jgi:hypothetical protein
MTTVGPIADPPVDSGAAPPGDLTTEAQANGPTPVRPRRVRTLLFPCWCCSVWHSFWR